MSDADKELVEALELIRDRCCEPIDPPLNGRAKIDLVVDRMIMCQRTAEAALQAAQPTGEDKPQISRCIECGDTYYNVPAVKAMQEYVNRAVDAEKQLAESQAEVEDLVAKIAKALTDMGFHRNNEDREVSRQTITNVVGPILRG